MQYKIRRGTNVSPTHYTLAELQQQHGAGTLLSDDEVSPVDAEQWQPLGPALAVAPPPPAPAPLTHAQPMTHAPATAPPIAAAPRAPYTSEALGIIALAIPLAAGVAMFTMTFYRSTIIGWLNAFCIGVPLITAILIAVESGLVGAGSGTDLRPNGKRREGPVIWLFGSILLWCITLPIWMFRRKQYGLRSYGGVSIAVVLLYMGAILVLVMRAKDAGILR